MIENKKKNIMLYLFSFVFLAISFVFFGFAFYFESEIVLYGLTLLFFILFCVFFYVFNKKITCKDGYNFMQAYFFYKKCEKNGLSTKPNKIDNKQVDFIRELALDNDYAKDFDAEKCKQLYKTGYEVSILLNHHLFMFY